MSNRRNVFLKASFVLPQWKKKAEGVCDAGGSVCETHTPECNTHSQGQATHSRGLAVHTPEFYFWHYGRTKLGHSKKRWATIWHYWSVVYFTEYYLHFPNSFPPSPPLLSSSLLSLLPACILSPASLHFSTLSFPLSVVKNSFWAPSPPLLL